IIQIMIRIFAAKSRCSGRVNKGQEYHSNEVKLFLNSSLASFFILKV
ncbi:13727_t:CDS:1, partial [Funneliformis mosseae]